MINISHLLYYIKYINIKNKKGGTKKVNIKTEFMANNLTIFGGYFNIFDFFVKSNIFKKFKVDLIRMT